MALVELALKSLLFVQDFQLCASFLMGPQYTDPFWSVKRRSNMKCIIAK